MTFNHHAIQAFGEENKNMSVDASWHGLSEQQGRLQSYLDYQWIRRWYVQGRNTGVGTSSILDVGSGNGRMIRYLADICDCVVGIEPYGPFYNNLSLMVSIFPNLQVHQATFFDYVASKPVQEGFDLIYASGVTPYFDDIEFETFFRNAKKLLAPGGKIIVRELGSVAATQYSSTQVNRSTDHVIKVARGYGLSCDRWGRAYPPYLFHWLHGRHPNRVTSYMNNITLKPFFFPFWGLFARLNLPTRYKLPRGQDIDYHVFLFRHH